MNFDQAVRIIQAMKEAGADAVKLQTYTPDTLTIQCDNPYFKIKGTIWEGRTLYDLYGDAYTPWEWQPKLKEIANELGMDLFSTPFDPTAVDFLEEMGVPVFKVASFENIDLPLLRRIAATGKPIIMSNGNGHPGRDRRGGQDHAREAGNDQLASAEMHQRLPSPSGRRPTCATIPNLAAAVRCPGGAVGPYHGHCRARGGGGPGSLYHRKTFHTIPSSTGTG
jgi:pseudaminic acid synthase